MSTVCLHTLLMPSPVMVSLRCRAMGQTPIYDQLRGERISADVLPSAIHAHQLAHSGRHCLDEEPPSAAAVVVRSVRPGTEDVAGHHRRVWAYTVAGLAGDEPGAGSGDASSAAASAGAGVLTGPRHARGDCRGGEQLLDSSEANRVGPRTPATAPVEGLR